MLSNDGNNWNLNLEQQPINEEGIAYLSKNSSNDNRGILIAKSQNILGSHVGNYMEAFYLKKKGGNTKEDKIEIEDKREDSSPIYCNTPNPEKTQEPIEFNKKDIEQLKSLMGT